MTKSLRFAPAIIRVDVDGVRLYNNGDLLDIAITTPISAFVGANGIGKSTMLALVNFALTGLVPSPNAAFPSVDEFAEKTAAFSGAYFSGRVDESARDDASVTVEFSLGHTVFRVTRGLFEGRLIRSFTSRSVDSQAQQCDLSEGDVSGSQSDLSLEYQRAVVEASGLANFDQFSFWQLFMMTFDERRHLLFWDDKTLQSALMISLGRSPQDAIEAEALSRTIERQESLARNARWRATQAANKRSRVSRSAASATDLSDREFLDLQAKREALETKHADAKKRLEVAEIALRDCSRQVATLAIAETGLEQSYLAEFSPTQSKKDPWTHPLILGILHSGHCDLCGSQSDSLGDDAAAKLVEHRCPICDSPISGNVQSSPDRSALLALDAELAATRTKLEDSRSAYHRLRDEAAVRADLWDTASRELEEFLSINSTMLAPSKLENYTEQILQLDREIASAMQDAESYREVRDQSRDKLEPIIAGLVEGYEEIERVFVPNFRRMAEQFIGRTVDVEFERRGVTIGLRFSLDGQSRRDPSELSESQQYFLDIALRMSLIQTFISAGCTMLIDTPEGSLDIAYETRAGLLFDGFSRSGYSIFMLSNLNASNLLSELATLSTSTQMTIFKMIDWARLSDVQLDSSALFDREYSRLDRALAEAVQS